MDPIKRNYTKIFPRIWQGPIDDPELEGSKALTKLKDNKLDNANSRLIARTEGPKKSKNYLINPESYKKLAWDITCMVFIVYLAITVPYKICFSVASSAAWSYFEMVITLFFLADILICFNTGFYSKGALVENRKAIAKNYLKCWFWLDLIASIPYTWFTDGIVEKNADNSDSSSGAYQAPKLLRLIRITRFLRVLRLLRLAKLKRILMKIEDYIASNVLATLFVFARLLSVVFFIAHWTACWWFYIGTQDMDYYPMTWITKAKIENKSNSEKYITSLYWAFTTMTTVGYGDITAITINEKIYAMFSMIVACGVFAYTVGSIGSLVSKQNAMENAYREQVVAVNRYMRKKELPYDLQFRVRRYLEYVWENKKRNNLDEKQILKLLSEPLRDEIYSHIHGDIIKDCNLFVSYDQHFINQVTRALESETYAPGDTVIEEGEMSSKMYFIQNGKVDIFHHSTKSTFKELGTGEYFGEIAFFTERPRCASAKCLDFVDLLSLSRSCMNDLLERFPEAKEKTQELCKGCEDGDYTALGVKCYICQTPGHFAIKCKRILLNLDHEKTKQKWLEMRNKPQMRVLKPEEAESPEFKRSKRTRVKIPVKLRGVIGVRKESENIFPERNELNPKLINYVNKYSVSSGMFKGKNELQRPTPINRPKYTLIYKDSEGSAEGEDEVESGSEHFESEEEHDEKNLKIFDDSVAGSPFYFSSFESGSRSEEAKEKSFSDLANRVKDLDIQDFSSFDKEPGSGKSVENSINSPINLLIPPKGFK